MNAFLGFFVNLIISYLSGFTACNLWGVKISSGFVGDENLSIAQVSFLWGMFQVTPGNLVFWACFATAVSLVCLLDVIKQIREWCHT